MVLLGAAALLPPALAAEPFTQLLGWGGGDPAVVVPAAAEIGFTDIAVWNHDHEYLSQLAAEVAKHRLGVYACIWLGDQKDWQRRYPGTEPPLQALSDEEQAAVERLRAEPAAGDSRYQYGGEPVTEQLEVFTDDLLCFHDRRVIDYFKAQVRELLAVPGLTGIAFDYFGYRNYRGCRCPASLARFDAWRREHPAEPDEAAFQRFSLDTLVDACNELADYVREVRPEALVTGHVYPVFLPEPLYGHRLRWDTCGQTAAWFFEPFWSDEKIRAYSRAIAAADNAAALIGIYVRPGKYPVKGVERIEREVTAIRDSGVARLQVCSLNDVLNDPPTRELFRRFQRR